MNRDRLRLFVCVIILGAPYLTNANSENEYGDKQTVVLTYKSKKVPCPNRLDEKCNEPDPSGKVAELRLPPGLRADFRESKYLHNLFLNIYYDKNGVGTFPENLTQLQAIRSNYLLGVEQTVELRVWPPESDFKTFFDISIKLASGGNPDAYKQHDNKESGYTVFDSEECYKLGANELIPVVPSDKNRCLSTMQLLISKDYKESYVECQRKYTKIDGSINKPVCTVWSRVKPGLFMIYRIPEIFIADRSWVGNDEIIKKYILSLTEQGR